MTEADDNLFSGIATEGRRLRNDLGEMLAARAALAQLELAESARQTARCGVVLTVAVVLLVSAVPMTVATLALACAACFAQPPIAWLAASALLLVLVAALIAWLALRNFRRDFIGLRDTLAELREDLVWFREWNGQAAAAASASAEASSGQPT
jgi:uncharacterized membrane protein YqjE